ncbi:hypothetical protein TrVE_jg4419 [Triparma verrucosa]|uniref:Uncharacterized protein n=1 Tax=Triparma verrucosa TaxID=1606542 RepID=A0A9W7ENU8_9STRA|nr:hypothetical protein TrVE_jg4419 [Triparma verrucosa]
MLEKTFVDACMQLSSGYVDVLKLFIVAGKAAYERGLTIPQVQLEISQCKTQTAGRPLMQEEIDLRTVWLSLLYLTLERVEHRKGSSVGETVGPDLRQKFYTFVYDVVNAKKQGYTLQTLKLEQMMRNSEGEPSEIAEKTSALAPQQRQMEEAILSQSMRLVFLTLTVLDETSEFEKKDGDDDIIPRPPIPGT